MILTLLAIGFVILSLVSMHIWGQCILHRKHIDELAFCIKELAKRFNFELTEACKRQAKMLTLSETAGEIEDHETNIH